MPDRNQLSLAESFIYQGSAQYRSLPDLMDRLLAAGAREFRAHLLLSESPLTRSIQMSLNRVSHRIEVTAASKESISCKLSGKFGKDPAAELAGQFVAVQHPEYPLVWILATHSGRNFEQSLLDPFIRSLRPRSTRPILQTPQIKSLLKKIVELPGSRDIRVKQVGSRSRIKSRGASKLLESDRRWTDLSIDEAFSEAHSEGHWVTDASIAFRYFSTPTLTSKYQGTVYSYSDD